MINIIQIRDNFSNQSWCSQRGFMKTGWVTWVDMTESEFFGSNPHSSIHPENNRYGINFRRSSFKMHKVGLHLIEFEP